MSWRHEADGSVSIASRSVVLEEMGPQPQYQRGEVMPSGWLIQPGAGPSADKTLITYVVQLKAELVSLDMSHDSARRVAFVLLPSILGLNVLLDSPDAARPNGAAASAAAKPSGAGAKPSDLKKGGKGSMLQLLLFCFC